MIILMSVLGEALLTTAIIAGVGVGIVLVFSMLTEGTAPHCNACGKPLSHYSVDNDIRYYCKHCNSTSGKKPGKNTP